ncbi:MAG: DUF3501 family protein [Rhodospirillaceae bacterium]
MSETERTDQQDNASAVHFIRFPLTPAQISGFRTAALRVTVGIVHNAYGHLAILPETTRAELAADFD